MPNSLKVKVIDIQSEETLFECPVEDMDWAYQRASEYEDMGIDVKVIAPTVTQTLTNSLGMSADEEEDYQQSVVAEMEDHDGSCCVSPEQAHEGEPSKVQ